MTDLNAARKAGLLSARTYNALTVAGIHTVEALRQRSIDELGRLREIGAKALIEIRDVVDGAAQLEGGSGGLADGSDREPTAEQEPIAEPAPPPPLPDVAGEPTLAGAIDLVMGSAGAQGGAIDVVLRRLGLKTGKPETLDVIGISLGITRERVRQIESKGLHYLRRAPALSALLQWQREAIAERGGLTSEPQLLEAARRRWKDEALPIDALEFMLHEDDLLQEVWPGTWRDKSLPAAFVTNAAESAVEVLVDRGYPITQEELVRVIGSKIDSAFVSFQPKIALVVECAPEIAAIDRNAYSLRSWRLDDGSTRGTVYRTLRLIGRPSHFTEVAEQARRLMGAKINDRQAHALMGRLTQFFVYVDAGTYGLVEWGIEPSPFYAQLAIEILEKEGHPLNPADLVSRILQRREGSADSLHMMLSTNRWFRSSGRDEVGLSRWRYEEQLEPREANPLLPMTIEEARARNAILNVVTAQPTGWSVDDICSFLNGSARYAEAGKEVPDFGELSSYSERQISEMIWNCVRAGWLKVEANRRLSVHVTDQGAEVLAGRREGHFHEFTQDMDVPRSRSMPGVHKTKIHAAIRRALGDLVLSHDAFGEVPWAVQLRDGLQCLIYAFTVTDPPAGRPLAECKIQVILPGARSGQRGSLSFRPDALTVLLGWRPESDIYVLWDAYAHGEFAYSANVQVKGEAMAIAEILGIHTIERALRGGQRLEKVILCRSDRLADGLRTRAQLSIADHIAPPKAGGSARPSEKIARLLEDPDLPSEIKEILSDPVLARHLERGARATGKPILQQLVDELRREIAKG